MDPGTLSGRPQLQLAPEWKAGFWWALFPCDTFPGQEFPGPFLCLYQGRGHSSQVPVQTQNLPL